MKILITSDLYEYQINGVCTSINVLRDELRKLGHDVRVLALNRDKESVMEKTDYLFGSFSIPVYPDARLSMKFYDKMIDDVIAWKPDIVHVQTEFSSYVIARKIIKRLNVPVVHTCHTVFSEYVRYFLPKFMTPFGNFTISKIVKKEYNRAGLIVAPTNKIKIMLKKYGVKKPVVVIPTGIDIDRFKKRITNNEKKELLNSLNIPLNSEILVSVSRIGEEKNIEELINYFSRIVKTRDNLYFVIVGDGPNKENLISMVKNLKLTKKIIFTGMIPPKDIYKYYQIGNIFVSASISESQGLTYIEALANGIPLVCRYDSCLDNVIDFGVNGFFYNNYFEYEKSINDILNDHCLEKKMRLEAFKTAESFSKEIFAERIINIYTKAIENHKKEND